MAAEPIMPSLACVQMTWSRLGPTPITAMGTPMKSPTNDRAGGSACAIVTQRSIEATPNAAINFTLHIEQHGGGIRNVARLGNRGTS